MPIYEYQCDKCGVFEMTQRITENALKTCPTCKSKVERIISNTSFVLKGSGWYITDYGRSGKNTGSESSSDSSKSSSGSSKSSGDSSSSGSESKASDSKPAEKSA